MTDRTDDNSRILTYLEAEFEAGTNGGASPRFGRRKKAPEVISSEWAKWAKRKMPKISVMPIAPSA